jgi:hypothetical protein
VSFAISEGSRRILLGLALFTHLARLALIHCVPALRRIPGPALDAQTAMNVVLQRFGNIIG